MKKKQKITVMGVLIALLVLALAYYFVGQHSDKCTVLDRVQNNCIPAGRCTPIGDPQEAATDCVLKKYDHRFRQ